VWPCVASHPYLSETRRWFWKCGCRQMGRVIPRRPLAIDVFNEGLTRKAELCNSCVCPSSLDSPHSLSKTGPRANRAEKMPRILPPPSSWVFCRRENEYHGNNDGRFQSNGPAPDQNLLAKQWHFDLKTVLILNSGPIESCGPLALPGIFLEFTLTFRQAANCYATIPSLISSSFMLLARQPGILPLCPFFR